MQLQKCIWNLLDYLNHLKLYLNSLSAILVNFKLMKKSVFKLSTTLKLNTSLIFKKIRSVVKVLHFTQPNELSNGNIKFPSLMIQTNLINLQGYMLNMWNWISFINCYYLILWENSFPLVLNIFRKIISKIAKWGNCCVFIFIVQFWNF